MEPALVVRNRRTGFQVKALLGEDSPKVTGYGGWEEVERARRKSFPDWRRQSLLRQAIPLILEGFADNISQDRAVRGLENMALEQGNQRPPTVKLEGPVAHTDLIWVIEDIDWGDQLKNVDGQVIRQQLVLNVLEWEDADLVARRRAGGGRGGSSRRTATVKKRGKRAETLAELCARVGVTNVREVQRLNKIKDPRHLKVGQRIRLPVSDEHRPFNQGRP